MHVLLQVYGVEFARGEYLNPENYPQEQPAGALVNCALILNQLVTIMIDAIVGGRLLDKPEKRFAKTNSVYVTAKIIVSTEDGGSLIIGLIAFSEILIEKILALQAGDSIFVSGELSPKIWYPANGERPKLTCDLKAHAVLSAYEIKRKRNVLNEFKKGNDNQNE